MNEKPPENNKIEDLEKNITKESVINSLRENPENLEFLNMYMDIWEKKVQAQYVSREETERLTFEYALDLAEVYRDAGLTEFARDAYTDASYVAQANGMNEQYDAILLEIAKL